MVFLIFIIMYDKVTFFIFLLAIYGLYSIVSDIVKIIKIMSKSTNNAKFNCLMQWGVGKGIFIFYPLKGYMKNRPKKEKSNTIILEEGE